MKPTTFEWLHPITELVGVLVWPVLIAVLVIAFRKQVRHLITNVSELTIGGNKAKFRRKGTQLSEELLASLTAPSPELAAAPVTVPPIRADNDTDTDTDTDTDDQTYSQADDTTARLPPPRILLREFYADRVRDNPLNAILEGNLAIERWFDRALSAHGFSLTGKDFRKRSSHEMSLIALDLGMISATSQSTVDGLSIMRDLAVDKGGEVANSDQAREFLILADGLLYMLDKERIEFEKRVPPTAPEQQPLY